VPKKEKRARAKVRNWWRLTGTWAYNARAFPERERAMADEWVLPIPETWNQSDATSGSALSPTQDSALPLPVPSRTTDVIPTPPPIVNERALHPLDRTHDDLRAEAAEANRVRLAWAKLVWLLSFLAVLLAITYFVPFLAEQTQYAITRGKQRAEHDFARQHLGESPLADLSFASQMVSEVAGPSVVHINTLGVETSILPTATRRRTRIPTEGQGSGIIMEASGYILTNYHVIRESHDIEVALADGRKVKAQVIGHDQATDLAVLKINADKLVPATWGDSEEIKPGALVWAVGSPFGLDQSITSGILSAKHRAGLAGTFHQDFLQSDAAVNPGNSGGPLVDNHGRVIGVNTAIVGDAYQGISFAIPSNVAREVYERVKTEKVVRRGWLGVELAEVTQEHARQNRMATTDGVYIVGIVPQPEGSPAARAGIHAGDVVIRWNDAAIRTPADLSRLVAKTPIGSRAKVVVIRSEQELALEVVVGERPTQQDRS
jgi:serine protease Do